MVKIFVCFLLWNSALLPDVGATDDKIKTFVLGRISTPAEKSYRDLDAMGQYLKTHLSAGPGYRFDQVVVSSLPEMIELMRAGKVDMISETPMGALALVDRAGAEIILHEWKKGVASYASMFIANAHSGIHGLEDMKGRVLAFEDPGSTSGFLIPLALLKSKGFKCVELHDRSLAPPKDTVGYIFAGQEINIASLVARKVVDVGAISDLNWQDEDEVPPGFRQRLRVVHVASPVPRSTVLVRAGLDKAIKADLTEIMSTMHKDAEGRKAMKTYHGVKRFDRPSEEFRQQMVAVASLYAQVKTFIN